MNQPKNVYKLVANTATTELLDDVLSSIKSGYSVSHVRAETNRDGTSIIFDINGYRAGEPCDGGTPIVELGDFVTGQTDDLGEAITNAVLNFKEVEHSEVAEVLLDHLKKLCQIQRDQFAPVEYKQMLSDKDKLSLEAFAEEVAKSGSKIAKTMRDSYGLRRAGK